MREYIRLVDQTLEKLHVPTKAIQDQVHQLSDEMQLLLSNVEEFKPASKKQKRHVSEVKAALKRAVTIMHKIQNLATIEIEGQK